MIRWNKTARWERVRGWWGDVQIKMKMVHLDDESDDTGATGRGATEAVPQEKIATGAKETTSTLRGSGSENETTSANDAGRSPAALSLESTTRHEPTLFD